MELMPEHAGTNEGYVSKAAAAEAIGCSRLRVSWLLLCENLDGTLAKIGGNVEEIVSWCSVENYVRWRRAASTSMRAKRAARNTLWVVGHPILWLLRIVGPIFNPS